MSTKDRTRRMRVFEKTIEQTIQPGQYVVARLDGRGFSKLTREQGFDHPFDPAFRAGMVHATRHLMDCGPQVALGHTQSDEISLLLHPECWAFGRRSTKLLSVLAGEGSAALSLKMGVPAVFDCRLSLLPTRALALEYFRWRIDDAVRNSIQAHAQHALRQAGHSARDAARRITGLKTPELRTLAGLPAAGDDRRSRAEHPGAGVWWVDVPRSGPATRPPSTRRELQVKSPLPTGEACDVWLLERIPPLSAP